jgi:hypothetical protein
VSDTIQRETGQSELTLLREAKARGTGATLGAYVRLSGPGWLQSAITLGGSSLTGALFLGVIGGTAMLWVQLVAMLLGVIMLCAISYITLSIERSPFEAMKNDVNPVLAWGWVIAAAMANIIWVLPQYSLAYSAVSQNLFPEAFENAGNGAKYAVSLAILVVVCAITLSYGKEGRGIKIYETLLKIIVAAIVACFVGVVLKISGTSQALSWGAIFQGFIPNLSTLSEPAEKYQVLLAGIESLPAREYWENQIIDYQRSVMISATATAVAINMTFLLPYSMLNKGWGKEFRGLAVFDLSTGMVIPFVLAVSCVVIASASMFHGKPYEGLVENADEKHFRLNSIAQSALDKQQHNNTHPAEIQKLTVQEKKIHAAALAYKKSLYADSGRVGAVDIKVHPIANQEKLLAAMLVKRDTGAFAASLEKLTDSRSVSNTVFGIGVLAMALSTISLLMLISGYAVCEMLGAPQGGKVHKIGSMLPAVGIFWPAIWGHSSGAFLAIVTSTVGYVLFPIACLGFFLMMNSPRLLKDEMPRGVKRIIWNTLMGMSLVTTGLAAGWTAINKQLGGFPIGKVGLVVFIILVLIGHVYIKNKHAKESV